MKKQKIAFEVLVRTEETPFPQYALGVEKTADVALWRPFECLLTRTVPPRYKGRWSTRKRNLYAKELQALACKLNRLPKAAREKILAEIAQEREVQLNVLEALRPRPKPKPRTINFGADFGRIR